MKQTILSGENKGDTVKIRLLTVEEVKNLRPGSRVLVVTGYFGKNRHTGIVHVKVNGKPKVWKTRPNNVSVPIKYGLYEYARVEYENGEPTDHNLYFVTEE